MTKAKTKIKSKFNVGDTVAYANPNAKLHVVVEVLADVEGIKYHIKGVNDPFVSYIVNEDEVE